MVLGTNVQGSLIPRPHTTFCHLERDPGNKIILRERYEHHSISCLHMVKVLSTKPGCAMLYHHCTSWVSTCTSSSLCCLQFGRRTRLLLSLTRDSWVEVLCYPILPVMNYIFLCFHSATTYSCHQSIWLGWRGEVAEEESIQVLCSEAWWKIPF